MFHVLVSYSVATFELDGRQQRSRQGRWLLAIEETVRLSLDLVRVQVAAMQPCTAAINSYHAGMVSEGLAKRCAATSGLQGTTALQTVARAATAAVCSGPRDHA
ncbi:hypothetical protein CYMTET_32962 [Cymbomonas tetramitiformis]|uniref:Uncharacterized protein n=1 Tax=Cymbomonas tetramitiformis TaxID=36881 RepID=A0AAE0KRF2_9CHLO|nr:hypothetical protein CYMTET_32962 [Cymbomonas tetramitiformis]